MKRPPNAPNPAPTLGKRRPWIAATASLGGLTVLGLGCMGKIGADTGPGSPGQAGSGSTGGPSGSGGLGSSGLGGSQTGGSQIQGTAGQGCSTGAGGDP